MAVRILLDPRLESLCFCSFHQIQKNLGLCLVLNRLIISVEAQRMLENKRLAFQRTEQQTIKTFQPHLVAPGQLIVFSKDLSAHTETSLITRPRFARTRCQKRDDLARAFVPINDYCPSVTDQATSVFCKDGLRCGFLFQNEQDFILLAASRLAGCCSCLTLVNTIHHFDRREHEQVFGVLVGKTDAEFFPSQINTLSSSLCFRKIRKELFISFVVHSSKFITRSRTLSPAFRRETIARDANRRVWRSKMSAQGFRWNAVCPFWTFVRFSTGRAGDTQREISDEAAELHQSKWLF